MIASITTRGGEDSRVRMYELEKKPEDMAEVKKL